MRDKRLSKKKRQHLQELNASPKAGFKCCPNGLKAQKKKAQDEATELRAQVERLHQQLSDAEAHLQQVRADTKQLQAAHQELLGENEALKQLAEERTHAILLLPSASGRPLALAYGAAGFSGSGSIGSRGVPVKQMLREACKQLPGRVVMVHEFRTSRVSSARTNVGAGQAESFRWLRPVRSMAPLSRIRGLMCSTSINSIRFYDRDVSAALNIRRIAAGPGRPRELSSWLGRPAMPNPGRPGQEWVCVRDRGPLRKRQRRHQRQRYFCDSLRRFPLIPSTTDCIVSDIINIATAAQQCAMVDIIPAEHIGHATAFISHAWKGDFIELVMALRDDFEHRWEAHQAYRQLRRGPSSLQSHSQSGVDVGGPPHSSSASDLLGLPRTWDTEPNDLSALGLSHPAPLAPLPGTHAAPGPLQAAASTLQQPEQQQQQEQQQQPGTEDSPGFSVRGLNALRQTPSIQAASRLEPEARSPSRRQAKRATFTGSHTEDPVKGSSPGQAPLTSPSQPSQKPGSRDATRSQPSTAVRGPSTPSTPTWGASLIAQGNRSQLPGLSAACGKPSASGPQSPMRLPRLASPQTAAAAPTSLAQPGATAALAGNARPASHPPPGATATESTPPSRTPARGGHTSQQQQGPCNTLAPVQTVVSRLMQDAEDAALAQQRGLVNQCSRVGDVGEGSDHSKRALRVGRNTALQRAGLLPGRSACDHWGQASPATGPQVPSNLRASIYDLAEGSSTLLDLLKPVDSDLKHFEEVVDIMRGKQLAKVNRSQHKQIPEERRKLLGYYVWLDVLALAQPRLLLLPLQFAGVRQLELAALPRLINVVGRTVLIIDNDWRCARRAWCLYEVWLTLKLKRALLSLTVESSLQPSTPTAYRRRSRRSRALASLLTHNRDAPPPPLQTPGIPPGSVPGSSPTPGGVRTPQQPTQHQPQQQQQQRQQQGGQGQLTWPRAHPGAQALPEQQPGSGAHDQQHLPNLQQQQQQQQQGAVKPDLKGAAGLSLPSLSPWLDEGMSREGEEQQMRAPSSINLMEAESVLPEDKDAILALLQAEVLNTHTTVHSLAEVEAIIYRGLEAARRRERKRPALVDQLYAALNACARSWSSDTIPQQSRLEAARDAFQILISEHFAAESAAAKELKAAADGKVELQALPLALALPLPQALPLALALPLPQALPLALALPLPQALPLALALPLPLALALPLPQALPLALPLALALPLPQALPLALALPLPLALALPLPQALPLALPLALALPLPQALPLALALPLPLPQALPLALHAAAPSPGTAMYCPCLQLWQLMRFLVAQLQRTRDEPLWCQELTHFATAAQRAYATQYSARYLDSLLKAAGTFDDMKVLRNFVNSQTRTRIGQAHNTPEA
ncbi:hypothetical protein QJQ45_027854 [Haematococcus lacustris]|nr:hypothetical protein QJQ45_027854 [Haematococcus lacustris]